MPNKQNNSRSLNSAGFFLIIALVVLATVGATVYFGQMLIKDSMYNTRLLTTLNKSNAQFDAALVSADKLVTNYNQLAETKKLVSDALPSDEDYPGLMAIAENAGNTTGVTIRTVSRERVVVASGTTGDVGGAKGFKFSLEASGSYSQIMDYIRALQLSARPVQTETLKLTGTGADLKATISGYAYYQPDSKLPLSKETVK
jgi:Tfp pilus assembly protein PilO